jgi:hypothetical protein
VRAVDLGVDPKGPSRATSTPRQRGATRYLEPDAAPAEPGQPNWYQYACGRYGWHRAPSWVGPDRFALESTTDLCLDEIDSQIQAYADDPLTVRGNPLSKTHLWSPGMLGGEWVLAELREPEAGGELPIPVVGCARKPGPSKPIRPRG